MPASRSIRVALLLAVFLAPAVAAQMQSTADAPRYLTPPANIVATFDAPPLPQVIVSPSRQLLALTMHRTNPTLAELARPTLRLAGARVDPKNNGPHPESAICEHQIG